MHPTTLIFLSYYQQIKIYNKKNSWLLCLADITSWFIIYQILTPIWHGFSYWPFHRLTVNHQDHYDSPRTYNRDNMKIPINWQFYHPSCWSRFCVHHVKNIFICVTPCFYWGLQCGKRPLAKCEWKFRVASKIHLLLASLASNSCKASWNLKTLATITGLQL